MKKTLLSLSLCLIIAVVTTGQTILPGYFYKKQKAPSGNEWESPQKHALNKELPRAWFFSFENIENALKILPENSKYWKSLDGEWSFNWTKHPDHRPAQFYQPSFDVSSWDNINVPSNWNVEGIQKDGSLKYGVPIYVNQPVIFQHEVAVDDWRGGVMRTPPSNWTTYKHRNEVGSYRRSFEIPDNWDGREIFVNFDGVDSFFYLWVNGHYVGFSKNSRNAAAFNITEYIKKGENVIAAEVYRNSDGSFLEAQDMFRLPGIYRTVSLYSTPKVHIRDINIFPDFDDEYNNARLKINTNIRNLSDNRARGHKIEYTLYKNELYSDATTKVKGVSATSNVIRVNKQDEVIVPETIMKVPSPKKWTAETPYRYTLIAELKDRRDRTIETISTDVGFTKVEIKDTSAEDDEFGLAGRYFYVNGETVKLKGVNRHETNPELGHAITREQMKEEIMLMKRANINHVRNAHYPTDPYWYYLCNKYGIYLEDEANIESHQYYYGKESLSHPIEWEAAHVARVMEMVHSNINNPSIVIWSLGNEAGPGDNFVSAYNALKEVDPTRPVQYERNNDIVDMGSNQYPSIAWINGAATGTFDIKYPFHISEYAHSMGNACGNLVDYWNAIESSNFICGGAIWDWIDQAIYNYDPDTGERYFGYGGDFGDTPNDGQFVLNGIIFADMEPKPQFYEVKKVYQYVDVEAIDIKEGEFEVFNKNYYTNLSNYDLHWSLNKNGKIISSGKADIHNTAPRSKKKITIPYNYTSFEDCSEYFIEFKFLLNKNKPWAETSYVQAEEQILLKKATSRPSIADITSKTKSSSIDLKKVNGDIKRVKGDNFTADFDLNKGTIHSLIYGDNNTIIEPGNGPKLNAIRAFVNNDNWFYTQWFERGLHNLKHNAISQNFYERDDGAIVASFTVESQAPNAARIHGGTSSGRNTIEELTNNKFGADDFKFTTNQIWTIYKDGSIELQASISSNQEGFIVPRLGYKMKLPQNYKNFTYYGRGPIDNYPDRKSGQFIKIHESTVADEFVNFPKPQDMGNHEDVRWCALTDQEGNGALFISTGQLSATALQYSSLDMILASHPHKLPKPGDTYLHLDLAVTGLGGNSCGQGGPLEHDRVETGVNTFGFIIRPAQPDLVKASNISAAGEMPISISRNRTGDVQISSRSNDEIKYMVDNETAKIYTGKIPFRDGGTIKAWYSKNPNLQTKVYFHKIEGVPARVIFASSQESGSGNASHLTDGDPNTIWHTMYSVTVAQHPHWVDLDAGEIKEMKGFTYLPRAGGGNGNVKEYSIQLSVDGEEWEDPIIKGTFENNDSEKRVIFDNPQKARFFRFTALSEQRGQDFASGAQITILAD
ncbi:glycoside hydrolase family 2 TIM barrel-domain containing protein [Marinilabiliaceae bacterium ANBcel2]|nr:glycoside hydrolase family 2 TIM barrel-domain containing protein [Marinilabiliaceae bacterium ANBcel2]